MKIKYIVGLIAAAAFMSGCESLDYTPGYPRNIPGENMKTMRSSATATTRNGLPW